MPEVSLQAERLYVSRTAPRQPGSLPELLVRSASEEREVLHDLPLRITYPRQENGPPAEPAAVILFSHGATGSKDGYPPLIEHWAAHGYVCLQPTHGDSLTRLSREEKRRMPTLEARLRDHSTRRHWRTRPLDLRHVLDALGEVSAQLPADAPPLDTERIGIGGHSFGAHTAQMLAGLTHRQIRGGPRVSLRDPRPKAFVWISPQGSDEATDAESWSDCTRPTLVVTGSEDRSPLHGKPYTWRIEAFEHLPAHDKWLLFLEGAHHGFGGIAGRLRYPGSGPADPDQVAVVQAATLAFWDAALRDDQAARTWLRENRLAELTDRRAWIAGADLTQH